MDVGLHNKLESTAQTIQFELPFEELAGVAPRKGNECTIKMIVGRLLHLVRGRCGR
jgi:hypothetical protein